MVFGASAEAAEFTGICPVLGNTQPPYPTPPLPEPPLFPTSPVLAIPQEPIFVTVDGKQYPICAVYMSIDQSGQPLPDGSQIPDGAPNDIAFPDLLAQPWIPPQAPNSGSITAQKFTDALIATPYWQQNGLQLMVNKNDLQSQSDDESAYFLWKVGNNAGDSSSTFFKITPGTSGWKVNQSTKTKLGDKVWYWVLDAPAGDTAGVPGPLPLLGAGAAYGWSRRLRQRIRCREAG